MPPPDFLRRIRARGIGPEGHLDMVNRELIPFLLELQASGLVLNPSRFDVRRFGARGNGTANDTVAVAKAIEEASHVGGVVSFPYGEYLTDPITLTQGVNDAISLEGEGRFGQFGGGGSILRLRDRDEQSEHLISINGHGYRFHNLTLDGATFPSVATVKFVPTATEIEFTHVSIQGAGLTGGGHECPLVLFAGTSEIDNIVFHRCRIAQDLANFAPRCPEAFRNFNSNAFNIAIEHSWVGCADILFHFSQGSIDVRHTQFFEFSTAAWFIGTYAQAHVIENCYTERNAGTVNQSGTIYRQSPTAFAVSGIDTPLALITDCQFNDVASIYAIGTQSLKVVRTSIGGSINFSPAASLTLAGTVSVNGTTTVTGAGTAFLTEAPAGSFVLIASEVRLVATDTANTDTNMVLTTPMTATAVGLTAERTINFRKLRCEEVTFTVPGQGFTGTGFPEHANIVDCEFYGSIPFSDPMPLPDRFKDTGLDADITIGVKDGRIFAVPTLTSDRVWTIERWRADPGARIVVFLDGLQNSHTLTIGGLVTLRNQPGFLTRAEFVMNANGVWELLRSSRDGDVLSVAKAAARNTSRQSIPAGALTVITGWTELFDTATAFVPSTGIFTAPKTGYYQASAGLQLDGPFSAADKELDVYLRVGAADYRIGGIVHVDGTSTTKTQAQVSGIVQMNAGETLVVVAFQNSTGAIPLTGATEANYFTVHEVP